MTDKQRADWQRYHNDMSDRLEAYRRACDEAVRLVENIKQHITERNYGLAEDACGEALEQMPHDFGAQTFHPLFDKHFEALRAQRQAREAREAAKSQSVRGGTDLAAVRGGDLPQAGELTS